MSATPIRVLPAASTKVQTAGVSLVAIFGGAQGGMITNPYNPADQGIGTAEVLFCDFTGPATLYETVTTVPLQPGQSIPIPPGLETPVWVNAATAGHKFSAFMLQPEVQPTPTPVPGTFPPDAPTSLAKVIPSYLYVEYNDDEDLAAFVAAQNAMQQEYIDWWNTIGLPVYTGANIAGTLLDWVALGLYGMRRPTLSSGNNADLGPFNTAYFNQYVPLNSIIAVGNSDVTATNDDIFKRIMTWNLYRGDGRTFNLTWLKRRIVRFLNGPNGTDPGVEETYSVSAYYASRTQVTIVLPSDANATILKEAIDSRAVSLPFQLSYSVTIAS